VKLPQTKAFALIFTTDHSKLTTDHHRPPFLQAVLPQTTLNLPQSTTDQCEITTDQGFCTYFYHRPLQTYHRPPQTNVKLPQTTFLDSVLPQTAVKLTQTKAFALILPETTPNLPQTTTDQSEITTDHRFCRQFYHRPLWALGGRVAGRSRVAVSSGGRRGRGEPLGCDKAATGMDKRGTTGRYAVPRNTTISCFFFRISTILPTVNRTRLIRMHVL